MAPSIAVGISTMRRNRAIGDPQFHAGQHDQHYQYQPDNQRDYPNQDVWRGIPQRQRNQCDTKRQHQRNSHYVQCHNSRQSIQPGGGDTRRWFGGAKRHHPHHHNYRHHQFLVCVLAIVFALPGKAQDGGTTAIANPVATSTGSVSNQAVQINQGGYSQQSFGIGHSCNGATMVLTPFYLGNQSSSAESAGTMNSNYGAQISFSVPLDLEMVDLCKQLARRKLEKERVDYELTRLKNCAEVFKGGFTFAPGSQFAVVCGDVVPIAGAPKKQQASRVTSEPVLQPR